jgi:hypothetical protein
MKKIKLFLPVLALALFSCDNYLDVNDTPNNLLFSQAGPDKLLPAAQVTTFRAQAINMNQLGNVFMNSWAGNVASFTGGYANEFQLNIENSFYAAIFQNIYLNTKNFEEIIKYPNADHSKDYYVAVAKICKAHYMQYLVDLYGDVPYTEAFLDVANTTPKYNDDQYVYRQLIGELDSAVQLIIDANASAEDITSYDVMLQGDMTKWAQFANTIKLRMLLRMSNNTGAVAAYRDAQLQALASSTSVSNYGFVTADVTINPGYSSATNEQENPFFGTYAYDAAQAATQNWTFVAMSGHAFKYLRNNPSSNGTEVVTGSGVLYPGVADPRAARIFRGTLKGVTQGSTTVDVPSSGTPARNGYGIFNPYISKPEPVAYVDDLMKMAANDGFVMTASEAHFIQAEAAVRYAAWFPMLNAQTSFDAGIAASFPRLGVLATALPTYKTAIATKAGLGWPASTTDDLKIRAIMTQKWIALMGVHGIESFIDYNRTGYPVTPLALTATQTRKPRRLIYPTSEYVANSANVPNITPAEIFATTDPSHPFWMLGDPALGN